MKISLSKNLDGPKNDALAQIDADALRALQSYRTSSDYAVAVYALKRAELSAYDAGVVHDRAVPMLVAEANAQGVKPAAIASLWREKIAEEDAALPKIEAVRQAARQNIKNAKSPAEIKAVLDALDWS